MQSIKERVIANFLQQKLAEFDEFCHLTKDGKCKYWNCESFGYAENDKEAPLDKFFPEKIKSFISEALTLLEQETIKAEREQKEAEIEVAKMKYAEEVKKRLRGEVEKIQDCGDCICDVKGRVLNLLK